MSRRNCLRCKHVSCPLCDEVKHACTHACVIMFQRIGTSRHRQSCCSKAVCNASTSLVISVTENTCTPNRTPTHARALINAHFQVSANISRRSCLRCKHVSCTCSAAHRDGLDDQCPPGDREYYCFACVEFFLGYMTNDCRDILTIALCMCVVFFSG